MIVIIYNFICKSLVNPWRLKFTYIIYRERDSFTTSQRTLCVSIRRAIWLMSYMETFSLQSQDQMKHVGVLSGQNAEVISVKPDQCSEQWAVRG